MQWSTKMYNISQFNNEPYKYSPIHYNILKRIPWWLFWGFKLRHLVDYCVDNSSVYPFKDDDDSNVTSLLAFTIMI